MNNELVDGVKENELKVEIVPIANDVTSLIIKSPEQFQTGANLLKVIKGHINKIKDYFAPMKTRAKATHQEICNKESDALKQPLALEEMIKEKMGKFQLDEQRKRDEAIAKSLDQYNKNKEKAVLKSEELCKQDKSEQAAEVLTNIKVPNKPIPEVPKSKGVSFKKDWNIIITDANAVPREYCSPNESLIKNAVKSHNGNITIPGVRIIPKQIVSSIASRQ